MPGIHTVSRLPPAPPPPRPDIRDKRGAVREWLLAGHSITQAQALEMFNAWRLVSIVQRLRREGLPIITTRCGRSGYARYRLLADQPDQVGKSYYTRRNQEKTADETDRHS